MSRYSLICKVLQVGGMGRNNPLSPHFTNDLGLLETLKALNAESYNFMTAVCIRSIAI